MYLDDPGKYVVRCGGTNFNLHNLLEELGNLFRLEIKVPL